MKNKINTESKERTDRLIRNNSSEDIAARQEALEWALKFQNQGTSVMKPKSWWSTILGLKRQVKL